jgi:hypothetical protein
MPSTSTRPSLTWWESTTPARPFATATDQPRLHFHTGNGETRGRYRPRAVHRLCHGPEQLPARTQIHAGELVRHHDRNQSRPERIQHRIQVRSREPPAPGMISDSGSTKDIEGQIVGGFGQHDPNVGAGPGLFRSVRHRPLRRGRQISLGAWSHLPRDREFPNA